MVQRRMMIKLCCRAQAIQSLNSFKSTLPYLMTGDSWCNGEGEDATSTIHNENLYLYSFDVKPLRKQRELTRVFHRIYNLM